jgi:hypothetical protein
MYLPGSVYSFQDVTTTPTPLSVSNKVAYVCKGSSLLTFVLPTTSLAGFSFRVIGKTCNWQVQQNAGQKMTIGLVTTTTGTAGNISSTSITDQIEITCFVADTEYECTQSLGNITVV